MSDKSDSTANSQQISDADKLNQLIDSVLNHGVQPNPFSQDWEELKMDETKRLKITNFCLGSPYIGGALSRATFIISFDCQIYHAMWKQCLATAFEKLNILEKCVLDDPHNMRFAITIQPEKVVRLFEFLKPLAQKTHMKSVKICGMKHIHSFTNFLANVSVREIVFDLWETKNADFKQFTDIVEIVKPLCVRYGLYNSNIGRDGETKFLHQLANRVESIFHDNYVDGLKPVTVVREMIKRKCKCIVLTGWDATISISDAEKIAKYFHHLNKKVSLTMPTHEDLMTAQVGEYTIKMSDTSDAAAIFQEFSDADKVKLNQFIDSVLNHGDQLNPLSKDWEELKTDESKRLKIRKFSLKSHYIFTFDCIISFDSPTYHEMWKECLATAFEKLNIPEECMTDGHNFMSIAIRLEPQNLVRLLEFLKPLAQKTHIESVEISEREHIHPFTKFLANVSVREIVLDLEETAVEHFKPFIDFVEMVKPLCVHYCLHPYKIGLDEETEFLQQLSSRVECIFQDNFDRRVLAEHITVVREMLKGKCRCIFLCGVACEISVADAEQLVKYFNLLEKKVSLTVPTNEDVMTAQVGEYKIEVYVGAYQNLLEIEHIDMSPTSREIFL